MTCWFPSPALSDQHFRASKDRAKLFPRAAGGLTRAQRAHRQLGRLRLGTWKEMCTKSVAQLHNRRPEKATRSPSLEVSRTQPHQGTAGPSIEDNLGDNSEGSSLLHPKDSRLSPALLLSDTSGRDLPDLPPQTVVYLCLERRARLEMSPH